MEHQYFSIRNINHSLLVLGTLYSSSVPWWRAISNSEVPNKKHKSAKNVTVNLNRTVYLNRILAFSMRAKTKR